MRTESKEATPCVRRTGAVSIYDGSRHAGAAGFRKRGTAYAEKHTSPCRALLHDPHYYLIMPVSH